MIYVIKIDLNGKNKYIYTAAAAVDTLETARRFYSLSYAKKYIAEHGLKNAAVVCVGEKK
ncbi:MAG: hypothetical protein NC078_10495 [Ruminococcus sp.]|nr:hypothetical protein [Ruminococcus sp.]